MKGRISFKNEKYGNEGSLDSLGLDISYKSEGHVWWLSIKK